MSLPIIYSGPYAYGAAPIEKVFAALKLGDLNPERLPTGKKYVLCRIMLILHQFLMLILFHRSLSHVADMVGARLAQIPRSIRIRYWHNCVLSLYGYLYFERN